MFYETTVIPAKIIIKCVIITIKISRKKMHCFVGVFLFVFCFFNSSVQYFETTSVNIKHDTVSSAYTKLECYENNFIYIEVKIIQT